MSAFRRRVQESGPEPALRYRREHGWHDVSWLDWQSRAHEVAAALLTLGVGPGDRVALLAGTSVEWAMAQLGIWLAGACVVPLYPATPARQAAFILDESSAKLIFCEDPDQVQKVGAHWSELPELAHVVCMRSAAPPAWPATLEPSFVQRSLREHPGFVPSWEQLLALGHRELEHVAGRLLERQRALEPDSVAMLLYTSGTTGVPKGVLLGHGGLAYGARLPVELLRIGREDTVLLSLPLAHIMGSSLLLGGLFSGNSAALHADLRRVPQNCQELQPGVLVGVPRIYEKLYAQSRDAPPGTLQRLLGGRMRVLMSGGAALARHVAEFFEAAGLPVGEGYGMTETSCAVTLRRPGEPPLGAVGRPLPGTRVRLAPDGEVLVSGPGLMLGYHRRAAETRAALQQIDGCTWLHTGDVGRFDEQGQLWISDRKKDLFKTSGGKYIAPQALENRVKAQSSLVSQVAICGADRAYVTALLTLDEEALARWASRHVPDLSGPELRRHPALLAQLERDLAAVNAELARFETIKKFRVLDGEFEVSSGELTPTTKLRRQVILERHAQLIESMYSQD